MMTLHESIKFTLCDLQSVKNKDANRYTVSGEKKITKEWEKESEKEIEKEKRKTYDTQRERYAVRGEKRERYTQ